MAASIERPRRPAALAAACALILALTPALSAQKPAYTLDELVAMGLARNPRIAAGALDISAAESAYRASRRLFNPDLEFRLGRAEFHDLDDGRGTYGFSLSQPIESPFKRRNRIGLERNVWEEKASAQEYLTMEVVGEIKVHAYALLLLQEKERLLERIAGSVREMEQIVRARADLGEVRPLDAIKLRVEVLKAERETAALRAEMATARDDLNALLDNGLAPDFAVSGRLDYAPVRLDEEALVERAMAGHPLVRAALERLEQTRSQVGLVKGERFPDLALTGFAESGLDGVNRGVGVSLALPLWNFKSKEVAEASLLSRMSEKELGGLRLDLAKGIRAAARRIRLAEETLSVFDTALLREVEESLRIAEVGYREGEISLLDLLDSQRTYNSILGDYYRALYDWNAERTALEKAAGETIR